MSKFPQNFFNSFQLEFDDCIQKLEVQQFVLWITRVTNLDKYSSKLCETLMIKVKQFNARTNFHLAELLSNMILPIKYAELDK